MATFTSLRRNVPTQVTGGVRDLDPLTVFSTRFKVPEYILASHSPSNMVTLKFVLNSCPPFGDWIWPALFLMPKNSVYGTWPRSTEIVSIYFKASQV